MDINYLIIALVLLGALGLLYFLIRKNRKDQKKFERDFERSEIDPEIHKDEKI